MAKSSSQRNTSTMLVAFEVSERTVDRAIDQMMGDLQYQGKKALQEAGVDLKDLAAQVRQDQKTMEKLQKAFRRTAEATIADAVRYDDVDVPMPSYIRAAIKKVEKITAAEIKEQDLKSAIEECRKAGYTVTK